MHAQERSNVGRYRVLRFYFSLQLSKLSIGMEGSLNPDVYLFRYLTVIYILAFLRNSQRSPIPKDTEHSILPFTVFLPIDKAHQMWPPELLLIVSVLHSGSKWEAAVNSSVFWLPLSKLETHPPSLLSIPMDKQWPWRTMSFFRVN